MRKKEKKKRSKLKDSDSYDETLGPSLDRTQARRKPTLARISKKARLDFNPTGSSQGIQGEQALLKQRPFCCAHCTCDYDLVEERLDPTGTKDQLDYWINPSQDDRLLDHLRCCHGVFPGPNEDQAQYRRRQEDWAPPFLAAADLAVEGGEEYTKELTGNDLEWVQGRDIQKAYETAKAHETSYFNESENKPHAADVFFQHAEYVPKCVKRYKLHARYLQRCGHARPKATVLDCFAGVGTGIVALKKLQIGMKKIIYCDHDKVAKHVYRANHDDKYSDPDSPKGVDIEHVFFDSWESMIAHKDGGNGGQDGESNGAEDHADNHCEEKRETDAGSHTLLKHLSRQKVKKLVDTYGPIDIVLGGPPCSDHSKLNAYRQGIEGESGRYLQLFGLLIREIQSYQRETFPEHSDVYFLAENVPVDGMDLQKVNDAFGLPWGPVTLDAKEFSPARRNRYYWTNIPVRNFDYADGAPLGPKSCLEPKFFIPAHIVDPDTVAKCNCLLASKTRVDEKSTLRMYVFMKEPDKDGRFHGRPLNVSEREKLMGYPQGYVQKPVEELFKILRDEALNKLYRDTNWRETLPEKYHIFAGNYHNHKDSANFHQFDPSAEPPFANLKLAPPAAGRPSFLTAEYYAKHLVGMAYSLPVVEHLLSPLQQLFKVQKYPGYDYKYTWQDEAEAAVPVEQHAKETEDEGTARVPPMGTSWSYDI